MYFYDHMPDADFRIAIWRRPDPDLERYHPLYWDILKSAWHCYHESYDRPFLMSSRRSYCEDSRTEELLGKPTHRFPAIISPMSMRANRDGTRSCTSAGHMAAGDCAT